MNERGEVMDGHNAGRAWLLGELGGLGESRHDVLQTGVAKTGVGAVRAVRGSDRHSETLILSIRLILYSQGC